MGAGSETCREGASRVSSDLGTVDGWELGLLVEAHIIIISITTRLDSTPSTAGPASCSAVAAQARRRFPPQPPSARVCLLALPGGRVTALVQRSLASRAARYQVPLIRRDLRQTTLCSPSSLRLCLSPSPPLPPPSPPPGYVTPVEDCTHRHASTRSRA